MDGPAIAGRFGSPRGWGPRAAAQVVVGERVFARPSTLPSPSKNGEPDGSVVGKTPTQLEAALAEGVTRVCPWSVLDGRCRGFPDRGVYLAKSHIARTFGCLLPPHPQRLRRPEREPRDPWRLRLGVQPQLGQPIEHRVQRRPCL